MSQFKYIIQEHGDVIGGIAFSPVFQHKAVAKGLPGKTLSAGFLRVTKSGIICDGESDSLKLAAAPGDEYFFSWLVK